VILLYPSYGKATHLKAGYWLRRGTAVAVVTGKRGWWRREFVRQFGGLVFRDWPDFYHWLRTGEKPLVSIWELPDRLKTRRQTVTMETRGAREVES
jgi:hypothetical protein